ncbi:hypothetical protein ASPSYDRAFT_284507 [Aspergillus sydowii CBS 593.65]|uniref:Uncharacterized protein n=1 Tax=Aspergillus sydowii CBS 593.65 TaxID=1036612 RepID=A0A1L9TX67_9EURO|nr:uncharacterized protein ASPSYDRAFT_284507 [Aspergillus sydowii CBS 593.65]OJJ64044.1 hypothetical protein ASPSYDRAFT_284507 [Aspergillus sydowii CBS 593.65]
MSSHQRATGPLAPAPSVTSLPGTMSGGRCKADASDTGRVESHCIGTEAATMITTTWLELRPEPSSSDNGTKHAQSWTTPPVLLTYTAGDNGAWSTALIGLAWGGGQLFHRYRCQVVGVWGLIYFPIGFYYSPCF